jgi:hypothetical protein
MPALVAIGLSLVVAGCHGSARKAAKPKPDSYSVTEVKRAFADAKLQLADLDGSLSSKARVLMSADYSVGVAVYPPAAQHVVSTIASGEEFVWRKNVVVTYRQGSGRVRLVRDALALLKARHAAPDVAPG